MTEQEIREKFKVGDKVMTTNPGSVRWPGVVIGSDDRGTTPWPYLVETDDGPGLYRADELEPWQPVTEEQEGDSR